MESGVSESLRLWDGDKHDKLSRGDASVLQLAGIPEEFLIKMTDRHTSFDVRPREDSGSCRPAAVCGSEDLRPAQNA